MGIMSAMGATAKDAVKEIGKEMLAEAAVELIKEAPELAKGALEGIKKGSQGIKSSMSKIKKDKNMTETGENTGVENVHQPDEVIITPYDARITEMQEKYAEFAEYAEQKFQQYETKIVNMQKAEDDLKRELAQTKEILDESKMAISLKNESILELKKEILDLKNLNELLEEKIQKTQEKFMLKHIGYVSLGITVLALILSIIK